MSARIKAAHQRLLNAAEFTQSYVAAVQGFIAYKLDNRQVMKGRFNDIPFVFRSADVEALKEVLIQREYDIFTGDLGTLEAPVILDVGHHIGTFSLWAFAQNKNAKILGFEADPETYAVAAQNAALGRGRALDWQVMNRAAWENDTQIAFSTKGDTMGHTVHKDGDIHVQGITLGQMLAQAGQTVDLMKLDIEGAEEVFLSHSPELLENINSLIIEIHPKKCDEARVMDILRRAYSLIELIPQRKNSKPVVWCRRG